MIEFKKKQSGIKYLSPDNLYQQISHLTTGMSVTKGSFDLLVKNCTLEDFEWNHMDQQHRPAVHNTYDKGVRIAMGDDFAISLTKWDNWPFLITVTDVYVAKGLFYQSLTIGGIIFLHSIISMEKRGNDILLKDEWFIASHKIFKFLHNFLNKKLFKLNQRLQEEDAQIRHGRFELRQKGYTFQTDIPNYYNSNILRTNTIYPKLEDEGFFTIDDCHNEPRIKKIGNIEFIVKKSEKNNYIVWPAACPHEGGPLAKGKLCDAHITCPWHGLRFNSVELSSEKPYGTKYGFEYTLKDNKIFVTKTVSPSHEQEEEICLTI